MIGRPIAGMLLVLFAAGPLLAADPNRLAGLELRMWEWRRLSNQLDMLPLTGTILPDDGAKLPDVTAFDKLVVDSLREVHNRGADLYNTTKDFEGAYRMYQGGLVAVRPLLAHRPATQKLIEEGIDAAEKETTPARRAFKLHETIEAVRKSLKDANEPPIKPIKPEPIPVKPVEPKPKPIKPIDPEPAPKPHEKKPPEVKPKDPVETKPKDPPVEVKKPKDPPVEVKKPKDPDPVPMKGGAGLGGKLTFKGQPLAAAEFTLVSLDQPKPRVFTATVKEGSYQFAEAIPPGKYVAMVTAKNVPEKYQTTTTSGLTIDVKAGASTPDIDLK